MASNKYKYKTSFQERGCQAMILKVGWKKKAKMLTVLDAKFVQKHFLLQTLESKSWNHIGNRYHFQVKKSASQCAEKTEKP